MNIPRDQVNYFMAMFFLVNKNDGVEVRIKQSIKEVDVN